MFTKTHQPVEQFINQFTKGTTVKTIPGEGDRLFPMLQIPLFTGEVSEFMVRYYKRSGESSVEDAREYYPCIVIQDFAPEIDATLLWGKEFVEGIFDEARGMREYVYLPVPMNYRFQVSAVTRRQKEASGINDWFLQRFISGTSSFFEFNKMQTDEGFVADVTPYTVKVSENPREDGRFEYVYDFTLKTYIHAKSKSYIFVSEQDGYCGGNFMDAVEKITTRLSIGNLANLNKVLQHEFDIT